MPWKAMDVREQRVQFVVAPVRGTGGPPFYPDQPPTLGWRVAHHSAQINHQPSGVPYPCARTWRKDRNETLN